MTGRWAQPYIARCHTKEVSPVGAQKREPLILPQGLARASLSSVLVLDIEGRAFQVEETADAKGLRRALLSQSSEAARVWQSGGTCPLRAVGAGS